MVRENTLRRDKESVMQPVRAVPLKQGFGTAPVAVAF
jgi:hypothetical protein